MSDDDDIVVLCSSSPTPSIEQRAIAAADNDEMPYQINSTSTFEIVNLPEEASSVAQQECTNESVSEIGACIKNINVGLEGSYPDKTFPNPMQSTMPIDEMQFIQHLMKENGLTEASPQKTNEDVQNILEKEIICDEHDRHATDESSQEQLKRAEKVETALLKKKLAELQQQLEAERISAKAEVDELTKQSSEKDSIMMNMSNMIKKLQLEKHKTMVVKPYKFNVSDAMKRQMDITVELQNEKTVQVEELNRPELQAAEAKDVLLTKITGEQQSAFSVIANEINPISNDSKLHQECKEPFMEEVQNGPTRRTRATSTTNMACNRRDSTSSTVLITSATESAKELLSLQSAPSSCCELRENTFIHNCSSFKSNLGRNKPSDETEITLKTAMKFCDSTGEQFIKVKKSVSKNIKALNFSAYLLHEGGEIVLHNEGCLMIVIDNFVAEVEIQLPNLLHDAKNFQEAEQILYQQLRIVRVIRDDRVTKLKLYRRTLAARLKNMLKITTIDTASRMAYVQLAVIEQELSESEMLDNISVCRKIKENRFLSDQLKEQAAITDEEEQKISRRSILFRKLRLRQENDSQYLYQNLRKSLTEYCKRYRDILIKSAPKDVQELLCGVSEKKLILITRIDLKLFADMASTLNKEIFSKPLQNLQQQWIQQVNLIPTDHFDYKFEATNKVLYFLCKSLEEIILQISDKTSIQSSELLKCNASGWEPLEKICWTKENLLTQCLERQYYFLFRLLEHFVLRANCNRKYFSYNIQLLNNILHKQNISTRSKIGASTGIIGYSERQKYSLNISEELLIWYCLLDDALVHVFPKYCDVTIIESTLQSYLKLIHKTAHDQLETLRVATHNIIDFMVQIVPNMVLPLKDSLLDQHILELQFTITNSTMSNTVNYRELANVFSHYWRLRSEVITEIVSKMPLPEMEFLEKHLLNVVALILEKNVNQESLLVFFRTYEQFVTELNRISFDWFIKSIPGIDMEAVVKLKKLEVVDNELKDTDHRTYRVVDPAGFPALCQLLDMNVVKPKHYILEILRMVLTYVRYYYLQRERWASNERFSTTDVMTTTCEIISTFQRSLHFLREQPNYASFKLFYDERVTPFIRLIEHSTSRQDFSNRVHRLKELLWFTRQQNEMDVQAVLQLCEQSSAQVLEKSYEKYSKHFERYLKISEGKDCLEAATSVAEKVKTLVSKDMHFTTWDTQFKQEMVPQILAGVCSVWSILVSEDVSSSGKYLNPSCVQILCVLRLLSVDKPTDGIGKGLAQVLTGQGKSLILALVAAMLALTGHRIDIACCSHYLAERDQHKFHDFYSTLGVVNVTYGSLKSLTQKFVAPQMGGESIQFEDVIQSLLQKTQNKKIDESITPTHDNFVLLIDEIDVFFSEEIHGNDTNQILCITISGIEKIQELIWERAIEGHLDVEFIMGEVWKLIAFLETKSIHSFLASKKSYEILTNGCELKTYTNQSLFEENLRSMIESAIDVFNSPISKWTNYKLNSLGQITSNKINNKNVSSCCGYENVFNYFRLKQNNFVAQIEGEQNFGYLLIECGFLSYAMLPMKYPLILGVSGTLEELNNYELQIIEKMYQIEQLTAVRTLYKTSNSLFCKNDNFLSFSSKTSWRKHIFNQANKIVSEYRAALIFFENHHELNAFKAEYGGQFDRLNKLTENTDDKEKCIKEAGVAKTITLATRGMGRGVDYKPTIMVEQNGGVHVIQTFFSMDVKEETQIKGRTARLSDKGSYELIVCREDLIHYELICEGITEAEISYDKLCEKRIFLNTETNKSISETLEENKIKHNTTIDYIKSYGKSKPKFSRQWWQM